MSKKTKLPDDVIEHWPEVFKDIDVEAVPIEYLDSIKITFADGVVWEVDLSSNKENVSFDEIIEELIEEYEDNIKNINFCIVSIQY